MPIKDIHASHEDRMKKAIEVLRREYASLRAGRATTGLLDKIVVEYYGAQSPINQLANISIPEPRTIVIQPWDKKTLPVIEKAILKSDLGMTPNNDGMVIRLVLPQLTQQRRQELTKVVHKFAEESRVAIRNLRRDANEALKKIEKDKTASEDEVKKAQEEIQKLTDKYIKEVDQVMAIKEKEIIYTKRVIDNNKNNNE